jgi:hypothetical protein
MNKSYVIIHGRLPHSVRGLSEYVAHIVYGEPEITVVTVGENFVALCEYEGVNTAAEYTLNRMGSFSFGTQLTYDRGRAARVRQLGLPLRPRHAGTSRRPRVAGPWSITGGVMQNEIQNYYDVRTANALDPTVEQVKTLNRLEETTTATSRARTLSRSGSPAVARRAYLQTTSAGSR